MISNLGRKGNFCITEGQKDDQFRGRIRDGNDTEWIYSCSGITGDKGERDAPPEPKDYFPQTEWMEWVFWSLYLSGVFWVFGYFIYIPLGMFVIGWLIWEQTYNLMILILKGKSVVEYIVGPWRRA